MDGEEVERTELGRLAHVGHTKEMREREQLHC